MAKKAKATVADGATTDKARQEVTIAAPRFSMATFLLTGDAPYVQHNFGAKARLQYHAQQEAGNVARRAKKKREPKDFEQCYEEAQHFSKEGWNGIPAPAFRSALISACRLVGFAMTRAKLSLFILADGYDSIDGTPLVRISKGEPHAVEHVVRNDSGVIDLRSRPQWDPGWQIELRVRWDAEQFSTGDVANLLARAGSQVGIGEGRPDSKNSAGMGWGTFVVG